MKRLNEAQKATLSVGLLNEKLVQLSVRLATCCVCADDVEHTIYQFTGGKWIRPIVQLVVCERCERYALELGDEHEFWGRLDKNG